jgi:cytochrome P450
VHENPRDPRSLRGHDHVTAPRRNPPPLLERLAHGRRYRGAALPPGPVEPAIVQTAAWVRDPVRYLERARARFGPIWTSRLVGFPPLVHLSDPDAIRAVFTGDPSVLHAGDANRVLEPVVGARSLFLRDGAAHLDARRMLLPAFQAQRMHGYAATFRAIAAREVARWPRGRAFELHARAQSLTLDVILEAMFGLSDPEAQRALRGELAALLDGMTSPLLLLPRAQVELGPLTPWSRLVRLRASVDRRIHALIDARRAATGPERSDVLSLLARAPTSGQPMSREVLRDELMTLLVAGHDTVATALSWTLHHLAEHPAVLERAHREVDDALGASPDEPARWGPLPWLDAIVEESLRLTPVLPIVARRLEEDLRIGGVLIPRGARAAPDAYLAHREPSQWSEPTRFLPERFLEGPRPSPYAYLPFGGGARRCIGMAFSLLELRVVLATVLHRVHVRRAPGPAIRPVRRGVALIPSRGTPLIVEDRIRGGGA